MRLRRGLVRLCVLLALAAVAGVAVWVTSAAQSASYETICWEAEDYTKISAPLLVGPRSGQPDDVAPTKAGPSGGKFVRSDMKCENDSGAKVVYKVRVGGGTYKLWGRRYWPSPPDKPGFGGCWNSFFVNVDGKRVNLFGEDGTYDTWMWTSLKTPAPIRLTPGVHVIEFEHREHGAILDQVLLTTRATGRHAYVPGGERLPVKVTPGAVLKQ